MKYTVTLNNRGNVNRNQKPFCPVEGTLIGAAFVETLEEAVVACREYITLNKLSRGNWIGGQVVDEANNEHIASISYNGRVSEPTSNNEIVVDETIIAELLKIDSYYHVTPLANMDNIYETGLIPSIGGRSAKLGEPEPAVYLFNTLVDCEDALTNWLGEEFDEDEEFAIVEVKLPQRIPVETSAAAYEVLVKQPIPVNCLRFYQIV